MDDEADIPAGWHEQDDGRLRYWDGEKWTDYWDDEDPALADDDDDDDGFPVGRALAWIAFLGFGALVYFGVLDIGADEVKEEGSATVAENPDCLAYKLVRRMESDGVVTEYRAVDAPPRWDCQYVLNDGIVAFRARKEGQQQSIVYTVENTTLAADNLFDDIDEAVENYGFADR